MFSAIDCKLEPVIVVPDMEWQCLMLFYQSRDRFGVYRNDLQNYTDIIIRPYLMLLTLSRDDINIIGINELTE